MYSYTSTTTIGDIRYLLNFNQSTASVIAKTSNKKYEGKIVIPEKIMVHKTIEFEVTGIARHAFFRCTSLLSIVIPNSVKTIREAAFAECSALEEVILPTSIKKFTIMPS